MHLISVQVGPCDSRFNASNCKKGGCKNLILSKFLVWQPCWELEACRSIRIIWHLKIPIKAPGRARGELEITYLDEELR
ncbi:hypothetical protein CK203_108026 [Vitis vinifera]|uniref:Uncharacterized protein n=1 Tax=Vitis vinifera TaxID=29760 RepID=A0A438D398_VITVI|nr:hypothetical protein CK203_108026 [Vitis vinifera]